MFKQSHIAVSDFLARKAQKEESCRHRNSLCYGSVEPDLKPSLRAKNHYFEETWEDTRALILGLDAAKIRDVHDERTAARQLGMVLHYLADYFTCPHNPSYALSFSEHCIYEGRQQLMMRAYLHSAEARRQLPSQGKIAAQLHSAKELISHIERMHALYLSEDTHTPESDCRWIVGVSACTYMFLASKLFGEASVTEWECDSAA